ncbi:unnamed protein product [Darwinula stevensoni]|uniref:Kringle domain-containing protein n=1 Tax=Darwinula stevensoni TaxID=69355 RepID=A0A7R9AG67_9CRUS|nr:unnamed protein product [Darwinula stevensoni]CAG0903692.1 unnamed protein product [Darwinula stevensoni]
MSEQLYKYPECRLTEKGREYIGSVNKTESGKECLRWDKKPYGTPDDFFENITYSGHFTNVDTWSHKNYCRNPSGKERPWCFVMDKDVQWEYCDIPICTDKGSYSIVIPYPYHIPINHPPECKMTQQGGEYIGRKNVSHSGFPCQPWRSVEPQNYTQIVMAENFPGIPDYEEIDEHYNFCRNPDGDASPYCYNGKGGSPPWEHCDLSFCHLPDVKGQEGNVYPECRLSEKGKEYLGKKDVTETGKPCLHWESQPYGMPWDFYNSKIDYAEHFLNQDPTLHKNYCRNPSLYRERPWCFVLDSDIVWEYCNIPFCHHLGESFHSHLAKSAASHLEANPPECKLTGTGGEYVGRRNTSISGSPCQHWLSQSPEPHEAIRNTLSAFSDEVDGSHNFCRNPDGSVHGPWCFIESKDGSMWEYCDVPYCPKTEGEKCDIRVSGLCVTPVECKKGRKGDKYMGTKNVTKSGHRCQLWMSRSPNDHDPSSSFYEVAGLFPDDLHPSHNFCRNPNGDVGGPWCFNGDGTNPSIDYCEVKPC